MCEEKKEMIVRKNNNIVKARYSLTTNETRIFLMLLYKLQAVNNSTLICDITHYEFMEIFKSSKDSTVLNINSMLSELRRKPIYFKIENESKKGYTWGEYGFINGYSFNDETKTFTIEASQKIYDLVNSYLEDGYTPNNLAILFGIRNPYTHRLYDLIRIWTGKKTIINYSVEELREYLMLEDKYPLYADLKKRAIIPAIKELNSTGMLNIEIKEHKQGRKVTSIDFIAEDKDKRTGFNINNKLFSEVPAILKDGINDVEVMQQAINFEEVKNIPEASAPAKKRGRKKAKPTAKEVLIKFCKDHAINTTGTEYIKAFNQASEELYKKLGQKAPTDATVNLYCKMLLDAVNTNFAMLTEFSIFCNDEEETILLNKDIKELLEV